jgi:hypothetical protein
MAWQEQREFLQIALDKLADHPLAEIVRYFSFEHTFVQLFVGGFVSYVHYLCLFAYDGVLFFGLFGVVFKGRLNRNKHQKPTFHPLGDFLNPALAL